MTTTTHAAPPKTSAPLPERAVAAGKWWHERQNQVIAGAGAVAVVALGAWFMYTSGHRKEEFAQRQLTRAREIAESGNLAQASSDLQKIITTYSGTDAASEALLTLNEVRMVNGQGELAILGLRDFLKTNPAKRYIAPAQALLGSALENAKKPVEAAQAYLAAADAANLDYLKAGYLIEAGRALVAGGKKDQAIDAYRKVVKEMPKTPGFTEASVRLAELTGGQM
jgi:tetratricopeptide (TPR) repeat protein